MRAVSFSPRAGAFLLALSLGCASGEAARRAEGPQASGTARQASARQASSAQPVCPMELPGVRASTEDTVNGAAVRFALQDRARVEELRTSVRGMVARHRASVEPPAVGQAQVEPSAHQCPACPELAPLIAPPPGLGPTAGAGGSGPQAVALPPAQLTVEDTEDGARVAYVPEDAAQIDALRQAVRSLGVQINSGACPLLGGAGR